MMKNVTLTAQNSVMKTNLNICDANVTDTWKLLVLERGEQFTVVLMLQEWEGTSKKALGHFRPVSHTVALESALSYMHTKCMHTSNAVCSCLKHFKGLQGQNLCRYCYLTGLSAAHALCRSTIHGYNMRECKLYENTCTHTHRQSLSFFWKPTMEESCDWWYCQHKE